MADTVRARWLKKLDTARLWLAVARHKHEARPSVATRAKLNERKAQVAFAERVLDRHKPTVTRATRVSSTGVELIAQFEGCVLHPYQDAVGVWTIGFGHTSGVGPHTLPLRSRAEALYLLRHDLNAHYAPPVAALPCHLTQNQFDAVVSLVFNCGPGCIGPGTTIGAALRRGDTVAAANGFLLWDKAGGHTLAGLTYRRQRERALFLRG
jgi:lysozyme